jgi:hypothetical protein
MLEERIIFTVEDDDGWDVVQLSDLSSFVGRAGWDTEHRWRFWDTWRFVA